MASTVCKSPLKPVSWIQMGLRNLLYGKERKVWPCRLFTKLDKLKF